MFSHIIPTILRMHYLQIVLHSYWSIVWPIGKHWSFRFKIEFIFQLDSTWEKKIFLLKSFSQQRKRSLEEYLGWHLSYFLDSFSLSISSSFIHVMALEPNESINVQQVEDDEHLPLLTSDQDISVTIRTQCKSFIENFRGKIFIRFSIDVMDYGCRSDYQCRDWCMWLTRKFHRWSFFGFH